MNDREYLSWLEQTSPALAAVATLTARAPRTPHWPDRVQWSAPSVPTPAPVPTRTSEQIEGVAVHEAGHALGVILGGGKCLGIRIGDDGSGFCATSFLRDRD